MKTLIDLGRVSRTTKGVNVINGTVEDSLTPRCVLNGEEKATCYSNGSTPCSSAFPGAQCIA